MKTTRLILALAAALSLGLAVFASIRTNASTQSTINTDELVTVPSGTDSAVTDVKLAWDGEDCLTSATTGVKLAWDGEDCLTSATTGVKLAWDGEDCLTGHASDAVTT